MNIKYTNSILYLQLLFLNSIFQSRNCFLIFNLIFNLHLKLAVKNENPQTCVDHYSCMLPGTLCYESRCYPATKTGRKCTMNDDCGYGIFGCKYEECWMIIMPDIQVDMVGYYPRPMYSGYPSNYGWGFPNYMNQYWTPQMPMMHPMTSMPMMPMGAPSPQGFQRPKGKQCVDHYACDNDFICLMNACVKGVKTADTCYSNLECSGGVYSGCKHGQCWVPSKKC
ncbi:hypothetical protein T07_6350 [Trichinella nelsoni]|uniref:DUF7107 domain-containing protein n=1 Tax=Trichinella nelsoni TaxID=6336 RepID=A0A0V0S9W7_9BILA|nr:hypothetical protein T07_6350 [Trichinella nelsoni]